MDFNQIDYVLELAKTRNFNRAAENLFVSQPSLTYHVRMIEEEIGFQIFYRSAKAAILTFQTIYFKIRIAVSLPLNKKREKESRLEKEPFGASTRPYRSVALSDCRTQ